MKRTATKALKDDTVTKKPKKMIHLSVNYTGIRDGETIIGCNPLQTRGVEMEIRATHTYYPIDECPPHVVRDSYKQLEFFSKMSLEERKTWLAENMKKYNPCKENHLYDAHNGLSVKFTSIQSDYFLEKLGTEVIAELLAKEDFMPMAEVYELFKPKDKVTKANRHNLVLRPENWCVKKIEPKKTTFEGRLVFKIDNESDKLEVIANSKDKENFKISLKENESFLEFPYSFPNAAIFYYENKPLVKDDLFKLANLSKSESKECGVIAEIIAPFTPSLLKSLLQKIIRTKCDQITHEGENYNARPFLITCLILLMLHAGSFNVNKQRFVTGMESALKRLAIIICEDSHIKDMSTVTLLLACAYIRQQERSWVPSLAHIKRFIEAAIEAHESFMMFEYETDKRYPCRMTNESYVIVGASNNFVLNSFLLDKIGSMEGDNNFFSHLASMEKPATLFFPRQADREIVEIPLVHCIDQHSFTGVAHFMSYDEKAFVNTVAPFKPLFGQIWTQVGSVNGRRDYERIISMEEDPFVKEVREAQECLYIQKFSKTQKPVEIVDSQPSYQFKHSIDSSWITGLVGPINVKVGSTNVIVVIRADDISDMVTIRNPKSARSSNSNANAVDMTPEEKEEAIEAAKKILRAGYVLKHVPPVLSLFKGASIRLVDDVENDIEKKYMIKLAGSDEEIDWEDACDLKASFHEFDYDGDSETESYTKWLRNALIFASDGVARDADSLFEKVLDRYPISVIKRLYMYLSNYRPTIKLYDISRDGSATKLDVSLLDIGVNHILCAICTFYPACLELGKTAFRVKYGPLLWAIRDVIKNRIDESVINVEINAGDQYWAPVPGDPSKKLFGHQQDCVDEMIKKNERNKRGHELFLEVGMGKTGIALTFIQYLVQNRRMPRYCVYTAPPSALSNARSEFDRFGIPYHDITSKDKKKKSAKYDDTNLVPFAINIIAHDQMRRKKVYAQLKEHAGEMLFIVDEFHLTCSSTTIRSSIALEISRLSVDFIAMTGTIVRNDNPADLIAWLEQIVSFYVDNLNYLCAFAALISRKASTGVIVNTTNVMCEFLENEEVAYNATVPARLGGNAIEINFRAAIKVCYEAVDREFVKQINRFVNEESEIVFLLALNRKHQEHLKELIIEGSEGKIRERHIFLIDKDNTIILKPETKTKIKVVITTLQHVTGYTLTKSRVMLSSVYPSNESTRHQFGGRINRIGQTAPEIEDVVVHCGVLSYMLEKYKKSKTFAAALREFAAEVDLDYRELVGEMAR